MKIRVFYKDDGKYYWFDPSWGERSEGRGFLGVVPIGEEYKTGINTSKRDNRIGIESTRCEFELLQEDGGEAIKICAKCFSPLCLKEEDGKCYCECDMSEITSKVDISINSLISRYIKEGKEIRIIPKQVNS